MTLPTCRRLLIPALATTLSIAALVQRSFGQPPLPAVEVASVKRTPGGPQSGSGIQVSGPRLSIHGFSLPALIWFAYDVRYDQVSSNPPLDRTYYDVDIVAQGERALTRDEFRPLMRSVLADRFKLKAHRETIQKPVYALVLLKNGHKFKETPAEISTGRETVRDGANSGFFQRRMTMADLANTITSNAGLDRPVVDATGLAGTYDVKLVYTNQERMANYRQVGVPDGIDIFTAVEQQLGLKLDARVAAFELLVIDHVEKPSEN